MATATVTPHAAAAIHAQTALMPYNHSAAAVTAAIPAITR
jgi:hypothetical protein